MVKIQKIFAREILDSRGNPTVEVEAVSGNSMVKASVPSGASTGSHEPLELRDGGKRFGGKGVKKAVYNVNKIISPKLTGKLLSAQKEIDDIMLSVDNTGNKSRLGANAILGVSIAFCKLSAAVKKVPLYQHISSFLPENNKKYVLPVPLMVILEGGKHADNSTDFQEFMIAPIGAPSYKEALRWGAEVYHTLGKILKLSGYYTNVGFEGAYGPHLKSNNQAVEFITAAIKEAGLRPGRDIVIALDPAASEFFDVKNNKYVLKKEKKKFTPFEMAEFFVKWAKKYPIRSIEDGLGEDDWGAWQALNKKIGNRIQIMGDDLTVTNFGRLKTAIDLNAINSILIKVNQIGTVTEAVNTVNLAKNNRLTAVVSHRSGETCDTFIADFTVGLSTGQCKFGAPARGERICKYNRLLRIEEELGNKAVYGGKLFPFK